jgi:hypothetical protein
VKILLLELIVSLDLNIHVQMTVVEAYVGEKNIASNAGFLSPNIHLLLIEGIAQNSTGSVYEPEVTFYLSYFHFFYVRNSFYMKETYIVASLYLASKR